MAGRGVAPLALAVALAGAGRAGAPTEGRMDREFLYHRDLPQFGRVDAAFEQNDHAVVVLGGNHGAGQELGFYEIDLPAGSFARLEALKAQVWGVPDHAEPMRPGTASVSFGEYSRSAGVQDSHGYPLWLVPPEWKPLLAEVDRLAELAMQHPVQAVRGRGAVVRAEIEAGAPVVFQVVLRSVGAGPATLTNPLSPHDPEFSGVRLVVAPDRPAAEGVEEDEPLWLDLPPKNVTSDDPKAPRKRTVSLAPGAELRFVIKRKLLLSPGAYTAYAIWEAGQGVPGQRYVEGSLRIELGRFLVKPAAARR